MFCLFFKGKVFFYGGNYFGKSLGFRKVFRKRICFCGRRKLIVGSFIIVFNLRGSVFYG